MLSRILLAGSILFCFSSCEKCYECSTALPISVNGVVVSSTPYSQTECGRGAVIKAKVEALEEEGYTCTAK